MSETLEMLLRSDHAELDRLFEQILSALTVADCALIFSRLDYFWARLAMHIRAEHLHLFPAFLSERMHNIPQNEKSTQNSEEVKSLIERLRSDHNFFMSEMISLIKRLRTLQNGSEFLAPTELVAIKKRLTGVRRRLEIHNKLEEERIYSLVGQCFAAEEIAGLSSKIENELTNLPPRFR